MVVQFELLEAHVFSFEGGYTWSSYGYLNMNLARVGGDQVFQYQPPYWQPPAPGYFTGLLAPGHYVYSARVSGGYSSGLEGGHGDLYLTVPGAPVSAAFLALLGPAVARGRRLCDRARSRGACGAGER